MSAGQETIRRIDRLARALALPMEQITPGRNRRELIVDGRRYVLAPSGKGTVRVQAFTPTEPGSPADPGPWTLDAESVVSLERAERLLRTIAS